MAFCSIYSQLMTGKRAWARSLGLARTPTKHWMIRNRPREMFSWTIFAKGSLKICKLESFPTRDRLGKDRFRKRSRLLPIVGSWVSATTTSPRPFIRRLISSMISPRFQFEFWKVRVKWSILRNAWQKWTIAYLQPVTCPFRTWINETTWFSKSVRKKVGSSSPLRKLRSSFAWKSSSPKSLNCTSTMKWIWIGPGLTSWCNSSQTSTKTKTNCSRK